MPAIQALHQLHTVQGALSAIVHILREGHLQVIEMSIRNNNCHKERTQALYDLTSLLTGYLTIAK